MLILARGLAVKMWIEYEIPENALHISAAPHLEVKWRLE
jgi:hypothetical protein